MKIKVKSGEDHRKPVALIRDGLLFLSLDIGDQRNGILGRDGVVRANGIGLISEISHDRAIYPGDSVTITF